MKKIFLPVIAALAGVCVIAGCTTDEPAPDKNPNGGGQTNDPVVTTEIEENAQAAVIGSDGENEIPKGATRITDKYTISKAGNYYVDSAIVDKKITVSAEGATLYLKNATLSNEKKVIESEYGLTVTLIGENTISNSNPEGSNAIDCAGHLTINGFGSLKVTSTKNGIKANSLSVFKSSLEISAGNDGIHSEIEKYDTLTTAPAFSNADGGWVCLDGANVKINSVDDGIQADTFVIVRGNSRLDITTNGGAPSSVTEKSKDLADGKGIKAGPIDWGTDEKEVTDGDYLILMQSGNVKINSNDSAIHSKNTAVVRDCEIEISTGNKGLRADKLIKMYGGDFNVSKSYEGIESAKVDILDGNIDVTAVDDGINASDETQNRVGVANPNCQITIFGGTVNVNAAGDGIDSNGHILIGGGKVFVAGPVSGMNSALDADGNITVDGGYLVAVGAPGMVEMPASSSKQNVLSYSRNNAIAAGTQLKLTDNGGNEILSYISPKSCQSVIISCPEITKGETYKLYGGTTELCTFNVTSTITSAGDRTGGGGMQPPRW